MAWLPPTPRLSLGLGPRVHCQPSWTSGLWSLSCEQMSNGVSDNGVSDGVQSPMNKTGNPASRFLIGILGTVIALLTICTVVLVKPYFVRATHRLETAHQQRVTVDATIEKRRLARKPRLRECWIDGERLEESILHGDYGTRWADLQVRLHVSMPSIEIPLVDVEYSLWVQNYKIHLPRHLQVLHLP